MTFVSEALPRLGDPGLGMVVAGCALLLSILALLAAFSVVRRAVGGIRGADHDFLFRTHVPIALCDSLEAPVQTTSSGDASEAEVQHKEGQQ